MILPGKVGTIGIWNHTGRNKLLEVGLEILEPIFTFSLPFGLLFLDVKNPIGTLLLSYPIMSYPIMAFPSSATFSQL